METYKKHVGALFYASIFQRHTGLGWQFELHVERTFFCGDQSFILLPGSVAQSTEHHKATSHNELVVKGSDFGRLCECMGKACGFTLAGSQVLLRLEVKRLMFTEHHSDLRLQREGWNVPSERRCVCE